MSDLRFEATAQKKQVVTCKGKRERKRMHGKKEDCKGSKDERE